MICDTELLYGSRAVYSFQFVFFFLISNTFRENNIRVLRGMIPVRRRELFLRLKKSFRVGKFFRRVNFVGTQKCGMGTSKSSAARACESAARVRFILTVVSSLSAPTDRRGFTRAVIIIQLVLCLQFADSRRGTSLFVGTPSNEKNLVQATLSGIASAFYTTVWVRSR